MKNTLGTLVILVIVIIGALLIWMINFQHYTFGRIQYPSYLPDGYTEASSNFYNLSSSRYYYGFTYTHQSTNNVLDLTVTSVDNKICSTVEKDYRSFTPQNSLSGCAYTATHLMMGFFVPQPDKTAYTWKTHDTTYVLFTPPNTISDQEALKIANSLTYKYIFTKLVTKFIL